MSAEWNSNRNSTSDRGLTPQVGFVLLTGLAILGAILLLVTGAAILDALGSNIDREQAHNYMGQTDHVIWTAAASSDGYALPDDDASVTDDGTIEIVWFNATDGDPDYSGSCHVHGTLGAIEYELEDRTIAHQGGGIWERTDDTTTVYSEPNIGYENETLQLHVMALEEEPSAAGDRIAKANHSRATALTDEIYAAATDTDCGNATDVAFRIESSYHEGWERYLRSEFGDDNVDAYDEFVEVRLMGVKDPFETATLIVEADNGISTPSGLDHPHRLDDSPRDGFNINAVINNTGDGPATQDVTVTISDESGPILELPEPYEITVQPGEPKSIGHPELRFTYGQYKDTLQVGNVYEYTIETEDHQSGPGSFYYGKADSHFELSDDDVETSVDGDDVTITATVTNLGIEDGDRNVTLEFDDPPLEGISATQYLTLDYGAEGTVEWTVNASALPEGDHSFTVDTGDAVASGTVEGTGTGGWHGFLIVEDRGVGGEQLVTAEDGPFTLEVDVLSTYPDSESQDVELAISEAGIETDQTVTLGFNESESVAFDLEPEDFEVGSVYEYNVTTAEHGVSGSFYVGSSGSTFEFADGVDVEPSADDDDVSISAAVRNVGVEEGSQNVTLSFDEFDAETTEWLTLDRGADGTVAWTMNQSALPLGENEFTISTENDAVSGSVEGLATGDQEGFFVTEDRGTGTDQLVTLDDGSFELEAEVMNAYLTEESQDVSLAIPDAGIESDRETTLESGERTAVTFDLAPDDFEAGSVYEYELSTDDHAVTGSFYAGKPGTYFDLSNPNATVDGNVTIAADLQNVGVETGDQEVFLALEYLEEMPEEVDEDIYGELGSKVVNRSYGTEAPVEFELNGSALLDGPYETTIYTENEHEGETQLESVSTTFDVTAGVDPGRVGLGEIEDANVTVDVLGSQVSSTQGHVAPMTLDVVTNDETEHSFQNPNGGNNINIGPTWQDKSDDSYTYEFTVDEETELTLRNSRYWICDSQYTHSSELPHYTGESIWFSWCDNVPGTPVFGPIDASQDQNLQNVRVRSAENNTIPALPAGTDHQLSATEVLANHGLIEEGEDELDLGPGEFVFLIENTIDCSDVGCDEDDIDALWNDAIDAYEGNPGETYDPNFNDLIVYVEVERAGVTPNTPSITITPGVGNETQVDPGEGDDVGGIGAVDPGFDGSADPGESPSVGAGEGADPGDGGGAVDLDGSADAGDGPPVGPGDPDSGSGDSGVDLDDIGVDVDADHVVIG
ncbi:DUF7289 family protein [Natronobeatus ordinarius]|uniref:DUF7289 family protein n=1 Tax=Natronobeatus ordinarius TaxID=2963433 RepID=UPI0020CC43A2|nr:hypothetical protein [Natronobeatus ordinarius]